MIYKKLKAGLLAACAFPASAVMAGPAPLSAFQTYSAASAGSIVAGPFALYAVPVNQILPAQLNVGLSEVGTKAAAWDLLSSSQVQSTLLTDIEPVVIGPGGTLYLENGHHTFTSLEDSLLGASNPTVYVDVIANYSNLTAAQFWAAMQSNDLVLPLNNGVPQTLNPLTGAPLPAGLTLLTNDPYRGLEYSILKNKSSKLFPTALNITGAVGSSKPGVDKQTGDYADFINADAYRGANGGLGLPYLSPGDIALATAWNLNPGSATTIPGTGAVTEAQLPGFILNQSYTVSNLSNAMMASGTLDGNGTFTGVSSFTLGTGQAVGTPQVGFVMQLGADKGNTVTLSGTGTYTGGTTITAGTLIAASDAALGAAPPSSYTINPASVVASVQAANGIIFNSLSEGNGTLQIGTTAGGGTATFSTNRPIAVGGETAIINLNGYKVTLGGQLVSLGTDGIGLGNESGISDLTIDDNSSNLGVLTLSTPSPYFYGNIIIGGTNKPTVVVTSDAALGNTTGPSYSIGQIVLNGGTLQMGASFSSVRSISLTSKSTIDTKGFTTSFAGTLYDQQRNLTVTSTGSGTGSVTFGNLETVGASELTVSKGSGSGNTVTFTNGITRDPNAALLLSIGSGSKVLSSGASTTLTNGIVSPWIVTDAGGNNPYDFAGYTSGAGYAAYTGYTTSIGSSTATTVDKFTSAQTDNTSAAAYAVNLQRNSSITGTGTFTIGDGVNPAGVILDGSTSNPSTISVGTLAFGGSEGIIYENGSATATTSSVISSKITGSGGLTIAGTGLLTITTNASTETGQITVDSSTLDLQVANAFASASSVYLADSKNVATANLAMNQSQTFSALNIQGNNSTIIIDNTGTTFNGVAGSTATTLTIGDSKNQNSTISSVIVQEAVTGTTGSSTVTPTGAAIAGVITKNGTGLLDLSGATLDLVAGSTIQVNAGQLRVATSTFGTTNGIGVASGAEVQFVQNGGGVYAGNITGAGDMRLIGGTLQLTGTGNSYSGGTFVELGSTLDLTTANVSSGNANITNAGGLVVFDQNFTGTYAGVISDGTQMSQGGATLAGTLDKDDSTNGANGDLILSKVQAYSGMTYIEAGTIELGAVNTIATSAGVDLGRVGGAVCNSPSTCPAVTATLQLDANNSINYLTNEASNNTAIALQGYTLTVNQSASSAFSGAISGSGSLVKSGSGLFSLTGSSSYSGGTSVTGGILAISSDAALGASTGGVTLNGGTLLFNGAFSTARNVALGTNGGTLDSFGNTDTVSGVISGSGGLTITDSSSGKAGNIILSGVNTYTGSTTLSGGTLTLGAAGALPANTSIVFAGGTLNFNGFAQTVSNLSGSGNIALGSATLTVNSSSNTTYSGVISGTGSVTKVGSGTLILDGVNTYTGGTTIAGGILEIGDASTPGAAILGPVTVSSGGTLSGHGIINGTVNIASGGKLQPGGTVGTLTVLGPVGFASGSTYAVETTPQQADLLAASGKVTITGANLQVLEDAGTYQPSTNYTIITAAGGLSGTFANISASGVSNVTSFVSYGANSATLTLVRNDLNFGTYGFTTNQVAVGNAVTTGGVGSSLYRVLAVAADMPATVPAALNSLSGEIHASLRSALMEDDRTLRVSLLDRMDDQAAATSLEVWSAPFASTGTINGNGNAASVNHDAAGVIAGGDISFPGVDNLRVGLAGAFTDHSVSLSNSKANGNEGHVLAYASWFDDEWIVKFGEQAGWGHSNTSRQVGLLSETDNSGEAIRTGQVFGDVGYKLIFQDVSLQPYADLAWATASTGAYSETGGALSSLTGSGRADSAAFSTLGVRLRPSAIPLGDALMTPAFDLGWQHAFSTILPTQPQFFTASGAAFSVSGVPLAMDAIAPQVSFDVQFPSGADITIGYQGLLSDRTQNHTLQARISLPL